MKQQIYLRRRGAALIKNNKGILLVSHTGKSFHLPGGGSARKESREKAMKREIFEELNLRVKKSKYLFEHTGKKYLYYSRKKPQVYAKDETKLFEVSVAGKIQPKNEVKYYIFWTPSTRVNLNYDTQMILQKLHSNL